MMRIPDRQADREREGEREMSGHGSDEEESRQSGSERYEVDRMGGMVSVESNERRERNETWVMP